MRLVICSCMALNSYRNTDRNIRKGLSMRKKYGMFRGILIDQNDWQGGPCSRMFTLQDSDENITDFVITPETYVIGGNQSRNGKTVTAYYDMSAPAPTIYPPRLNAEIIVVEQRGIQVKVDWFGRDMVSSDRTLKINPSVETVIMTQNGLPYEGSLARKNLIVFYSMSTRSIPAQTTPEEIIVLCE